MKTANENKKDNKKFAPLITYLIATLFLVAGLLVPLGANGFGLSGMLAAQLPDAIRNIIGVPLWENAVGERFTTSVHLTPFGMGIKFDIAAFAALMYAVMTLIALVMIIPACLSGKTKKTCRKIAFGVEITAAIFLIVYTLSVCTVNVAFNYAPFVALGGVLIILCAQSIIAFKRRGAVKTVLFWLSALTTLCLFPLATLITVLAGPLTEFTSQIGMGAGTFGDSSGLKCLYDFFGGGFELYAVMTPAQLSYVIFATVTSFVIVYNLFADMVALSIKNKRYTLTLNLIRYIAALVLTGVTVVLGTAFKADGASVGFLSLPILAILFAQTIVALARLIKKIKAVKKKQAARAAAAAAPSPEALERNRQIYSAPEEAPRVVATNPNPPVIVNVNAPAANERTEPAPEAYQQPAPQPVYQPAPETYQQPAPQPVYQPAGYTGPTDGFIQKLSDEEKTEFCRIFIEKKKGALSYLPEYVVGGENRKFFSTVFIYFARVREIVSDELMNKFYEELNVM